MILVTFLIFLAIFLIIGIASIFRSRHSVTDYLVAGRSIPAWLVALSAVATNNSGYMFIGMIGFTYKFGLQSIWMMIPWLLGDFLASIKLYPEIRRESEELDSHSFGSLIAQWKGETWLTLRSVIGFISVLFLTVYTAAQFTAGGKALFATLDLSINWGIIIGAISVIVYSFAGGIRASIWTDAAQSIVMIFAMAYLLVMGYLQIPETGAAGVASLPEGFWSINPLDVGDSSFILAGLIIFAYGLAGFAAAGQPQIAIRFMTLKSVEEIRQFRYYYYGWFSAFWVAAIGVGMLARLHIADKADFDQELALPTLATEILPDFGTGIILAGVFAATISTADSLVLSCSAALTRDFYHKIGESYVRTKIGTAIILLSALGLALWGERSVFNLVLDSWAVMGAAFIPLMFVLMTNRKLSEWKAVAMVLGGVLGVYGAKYLTDWGVYEILPGMVLSTLVYFIPLEGGHIKNHEDEVSN